MNSTKPVTILVLSKNFNLGFCEFSFILVLNYLNLIHCKNWVQLSAGENFTPVEYVLSCVTVIRKIIFLFPFLRMDAR